MNTSDCFEILQTEATLGALFEVVQYKTLQGSDDLDVAEKIFGSAFINRIEDLNLLPCVFQTDIVYALSNV